MKILIVDDDPWLRQALQIPLVRAGYEVEEAADGQAAWEMWQQQHIRLLITDWMMPTLDGLELIRRIRAADAAAYTYIILLTVRDMKEDVVKGLDAGADDYLTKPFSLDELRARLAAGERILELELRLSQLRDQMEKLATYDSLTNLLNRWAISKHVEAELCRVQRDGGSLSLMLIDLDHFKVVNDQYGHLVGDRALRSAAEVLVQNIRPYDWAGRWGGEEFLVALPETDLPQAGTIAERVRASVAGMSLALRDGETLRLQVSVGVSSTPMPGGAPPLAFEALLHQADEALYQAKQDGRNRVRLYNNAAQGQ